jgi:hypothetical protein
MTVYMVKSSEIPTTNEGLHGKFMGNPTKINVHVGKSRENQTKIDVYMKMKLDPRLLGIE